MKRGQPLKRSPFRAKPKRAKRPKPLVPKQIGMSFVAKVEAPLRDRKHLQRVASQPCLVCGLSGLTQAHHIRECFPRTLGVRIGDDKTVPLCVTHHAELHLENTDAFWKRYRIDPKAWAISFYAASTVLREPT